MKFQVTKPCHLGKMPEIWDIVEAEAVRERDDGALVAEDAKGEVVATYPTGRWLEVRRLPENAAGRTPREADSDKIDWPLAFKGLGAGFAAMYAFIAVAHLDILWFFRLDALGYEQIVGSRTGFLVLFLVAALLGGGVTQALKPTEDDSETSGHGEPEPDAR